MQSSSRAPVLSATLRRDSCWITYGPLQHFVQAPALRAAERTALDHAHGVSDVRVVVLVVRVQRRRRADDLLVHPVLASRVDADRDGLVGLVGDDDALAHLDVRLRGRLGERGGLRARLRGAALALLQAVRAAVLRLDATRLGALLSALLDRALRTRLTGVRGALLTAPLLRRQRLLRLGLLGGSGSGRRLGSVLGGGVLGGRLLSGRLLGRGRLVSGGSSAGGSSAGGSSTGGSSAGGSSTGASRPQPPRQGPPPPPRPRRARPPRPRRRSARRPAPPARRLPPRPGREPPRAGVSSGASSFTFSSFSSIYFSQPADLCLDVDAAQTRLGERAR